VDNSAPDPTRPEPTYKSGKVVQTNGATSHVAKIFEHGKTIPLWADIRTASRRHMQISFQGRRQQIVGDCKQLKTDVDSYNQNANDGAPIQMIFDFTLDIEEMGNGDLAA
jgi:hypothetical protein